MADYYCSSRTNYFRVKDLVVFSVWAERRGVKIIANPTRHPGHFALIPDDSEYGGFPFYDIDSDGDVDFATELAEHLAEGSIAVILEAGAEKLRYIIGLATAVNSKGDVVRISLEDIYELAAKSFGLLEVTRAEY